MSKNDPFTFLEEHGTDLSVVARQAQQLVYKDPNSALAKLRQFGELLLQRLAPRAQVRGQAPQTQLERIQQLELDGEIDRAAASVFHAIRIAGNDAVHGARGDTKRALEILELAHEGAVFVHRALRGVAQPQVYRVPENRDIEAELHEKVERVRAESTRSALEAAETAKELHAQLRTEMMSRLEAERVAARAELDAQSIARTSAQVAPVASRSSQAPTDAIPSCPDPSCGKPMVRRTARRGPNAGSEFWGCSGYPSCRQTHPLAGATTSPSPVADSPAADVRRSRRAWTDVAVRPGWNVRYASAGGRLRSFDPLESVSGELRAAVSQVAVFVSQSDGSTISKNTQLVVDVIRRILGRGLRPPIDPQVEAVLLDRAGLKAHVRSAPSPGDLALQLAESWPGLDDRAVNQAVCFREPFSMDGQARLDASHPLLHPSAERPFLESWVSGALGPSAGNWFTPQASLDSLLPLTQDASGARRVDFLFAHPMQSPCVVEIDGDQHSSALEVDAERDSLLRSAGIDVHRITAADSLKRGGRAQARLSEALAGAREAEERPPDQEMSLVWGPSVVHRVTLGLLEAIEAGWLSQPAWTLSISEPLGIAPAAVRSALELLDAVDNVWGGECAPERVVLQTDEGVYSLVRNSKALYDLEQIADANQSGIQSATITVDLFHGPYHQLPIDQPRSVVIRSTWLPLDIVDDRLAGGTRQTLADPATPARVALERLLQGLFAKRHFQPDGPEPRGQEVALRRMLAGRDTVVLLPTGAGKSMIYQLAGLLMPGLTLVVDPIVSLIEDQLDGLRQQGIDRAIGITSADTRAGTVEEKLHRVRSGDALFVFVAPERLQQRAFREALRTLAVGNPINMCVVDEAHCVSEWGHDFRTSYLDLGRVLRSIAGDTTGTAPGLLALTGTASRTVLKDLLIELSIDRSDPEVIITPMTFDRQELRYSVVAADDDELAARLVGTLRALPSMFTRPQRRGRSPSDFFRPSGRNSACGIVFCPTVNGRDTGVITISSAISDALGIRAPIYSGTAPKGWRDFDRQKRENAKAFKRDEVTLLVATKAYGMGIDKPNVRFIVHIGVPGSIEAYYQEAGRAGRDRAEAHCIILHTPSDRDIHEFFHGNTFRGVDEDAKGIETTLALIGELGRRRSLSIPMGPDDEQREKAIHRLKLLGVVQDYLVDWGGKQFELKLRAVSAEDIDAGLLSFIRRSQPGRVAAYESMLANDGQVSLGDRVVLNARRMIEYVYSTIVAARKRAVDEMILLADNCVDDAQIRDRILRYLELGQVAEQLEKIVDLEPFSFDAWLELYTSIDTADDAREWRGATARLLESDPDHPGLLVGRGLAEALVAAGSDKLFASSISQGIRSALTKFEIKSPKLGSLVRSLIMWTRSRRPAWVPLLYLVAERELGDDADRVLDKAERSALKSAKPKNAMELGMIVTRRIERMNRRLTELTRKQLEVSS